MKKILHISKYYYPFSGGTEQIARDCVLALKGGYSQKVIAFNDGKEDKVDIVDGIEVMKCGCFTKIAAQSLSTSYGKQLHRVMKEFDPDIVVFHYPNPFVAALLLREMKNTKAKLVVYWHLDIVRQKYLKLLFNPQNRSLLARADKVIATSPNYIEGSKWLQSVKDKCVVVPNCINVERMTITPDIEKRATEIREENKDKTICVAVGRHTEYKGFTYLVQASKLIDDRFRIYITGTGELTEKLHEEARGDNKITFTGRIDDTELKAFIKFLFLNVMPRTLQCIIFIMYAVAKRENGHSFMRPVNHITILVDTDASMIFQNLLSHHWHTRYLKCLHGWNTLFLVRREFNKLFQILECHHNVHLSAFWLRAV